MVTAARIAAEECSDASPLRQRVQTIERTALRLLESAEEVLSIAIAEQVSEDEPFNPASVLVEAIGDVAALGRPVRLTVQGACDWHAKQGNASQLVALVHSLLANAADHGVEGDPVWATLNCSPGAVELSVVNTVGPARHRGLGIGTHICDQLAARLGAHLSRRRTGDRYEVVLVLPSPVRTGRSRPEHSKPPGRRAAFAISDGH